MQLGGKGQTLGATVYQPFFFARVFPRIVWRSPPSYVLLKLLPTKFSGWGVSRGLLISRVSFVAMGLGSTNTVSCPVAIWVGARLCWVIAFSPLSFHLCGGGVPSPSSSLFPLGGELSLNAVTRCGNSVLFLLWISCCEKGRVGSSCRVLYIRIFNCRASKGWPLRSCAPGGWDPSSLSFSITLS